MSYEPTIWRTGDTVTAEKLNKIEQAIVADNTAIEGKVGRDEFDTEIATLESKVGSPLIASTVSEMTETDRVYVYTGSETGYTSGNWYYYDGTAWTSGGVYNAVAIETDTTLSVSGKAADAKKAGDEINSLKEDLNAIQTATSEDVGKALKAKTVSGGKVTEWEFGDVGENEDVPHALVVAILDRCVVTDAVTANLIGMLKEYWGSGALASVTANLTNCYINNDATIVAVGGTYTATLSARAGYSISAAYYTMGGTTYQIADGHINIANVTGDIVINATAIEYDPIITTGLLHRWVGSDANLNASGDHWDDRVGDLYLISKGAGVTSNGDAVCLDGNRGSFLQRESTDLEAQSPYTVEIVFDNKNANVNALVVQTMWSNNSLTPTGFGMNGGTIYSMTESPTYPNSVTTGKQVITVRNDASVPIIKNGVVLIGTGTNNFRSSTYKGIVVGTRTNNANELLYGDIYEIRIYSGHLTDAQIQSNHAVDIARYGIEV